MEIGSSFSYLSSQFTFIDCEKVQYKCYIGEGEYMEQPTEQEQSLDWQGILRFALPALVLVIIIFSWMNMNGAAMRSHPNAGFNEVLANADISHQPRLGDAHAPITMIAFEDFACEHCRNFNHDIFPQIKKEFIDTGKVKFYFLNVAVAAEYSMALATAAECAYQQDVTAFWEYKDSLMRVQLSDEHSTQALTQLAVAPLDTVALQTCMDSGVTETNVQEDYALAERAGLRGVPAIVVDGTITKQYSYEDVAKYINRALDNL